jgi:hypothetical protein
VRQIKIRTPNPANERARSEAMRDDWTAKRTPDAATEDPLHMLKPHARVRVENSLGTAYSQMEEAEAGLTEQHGPRFESWPAEARTELARVKINAAISALSMWRREFDAQKATIRAKLSRLADWDTGFREELESRLNQELSAALAQYCDWFLGGLGFSDEDRRIILARSRVEPQPQFVDREAVYQAWRDRHLERSALKDLCNRTRKDRADIDKWRKRKKFNDSDNWAMDLVKALTQ